MKQSILLELRTGGGCFLEVRNEAKCSLELRNGGGCF
jgi:hypothetical protein